MSKQTLGRKSQKDVSKQQFAERLKRLMHAKGWHQSELARQAGIARDSVSVYIRGRALPKEENAQALARALNVSLEELMPNGGSATEGDIPAIELRVSQQAPQETWLSVNKLVSTKTAIAIIELLEREHVSLCIPVPSQHES
jgi:transcriptional regulator with XRE-family HTH domain